MRITSIELHPSGSSEVCVLSFRDPSKVNPYNVKSISGLDGSDGIAPKFYGKAGNSAANFYSMALQKREVVMAIQLNPQFALGKSYSDLRDDLYRMIGSSRTGLVEMQFLDENSIVAVLSGFVVKAEAVQFDKTPSVQLTLSAVDPMLKSPTPFEVPVSGLDPMATVITDAVSTAPHGFSFVMNITANLPSIKVADPDDESWSFEVVPPPGFFAGDELYFSSDPTNKQLYIVRGVNTIYLADVITPGSIWPIIFPGDNHFSFMNYGSMNWSDIWYYQTFWGV